MTKKQKATIEYLKSKGPLYADRLKEYKQRVAKREAEKKNARVQRAAEAEQAMKLVKVGDVFSCSWGYEQTNVDFFQVVALVGKNSVRVKQVAPAMLKDDPTGPFAADRTYEIDPTQMLPATRHSVFIKDQANGDVKRIQATHYYGKITPYIKLDSFAYAYPEKPGAQKHYESWGY